MLVNLLLIIEVICITEWRPIENYEGYYEVSNTGLVRSLDRIITDSNGIKHKRNGSIMKQSLRINNTRPNDTGYYVVNLRKSHTSSVQSVHRLVANAFIENPHNLPTINHIDGNKHNNDVSNLEWASYGDNNVHALKNNLRRPKSNPIVQFDMSGKYIKRYKSVSEASRETGIGRSNISHCVNHLCNYTSAGGFIWKKIKECNDYLVNESTTEDELLPEAQEQESVS